MLRLEAYSFLHTLNLVSGKKVVRIIMSQFKRPTTNYNYIPGGLSIWISRKTYAPFITTATLI